MDVSTFRRPSSTGWVAAAVTALVAGCANPGGVPPATSSLLAPATLSAEGSLQAVAVSPASWPTDRWWGRYDDAQLQQLVELGLQYSPTVQLAQARVRQALAVSGLAEAQQRASASANAKDSRQRFSEHSTVAPALAGQWRYFNEGTLNLTQELDLWGKQQSLVEAAVDRVHASEVEAQAARVLLSSAIVQTYLRFALAHEQRLLAERTLALRSALLALTRQRLQAGLDSQVELQQAAGLLPAAQQQVATQQEIMATSAQQLAALVGQGPDFGRQLQRPHPSVQVSLTLPSQLPAELVGRRPDVVAARWRVEAALRDVDAARAQFYPNVSLVAYAGLQSLGWSQFLNNGSLIAGVGPAVSLPLFDGGRLRSQLGTRHAERDVAIEQYNQTVIDALQDVVRQITTLQWLQTQRQQQLDAVAAAQATLTLTLQRHHQGLATQLQALTAEALLIGQQSALQELDSRLLQADALLMRALGGGASV